MIRRLALVLAGAVLAGGCYWLVGPTGFAEATHSPHSSIQLPNAVSRSAATGFLPSQHASASSARIAQQPIHRRRWDPGYLSALVSLRSGDPIRFELVAGEFASGAVGMLRRSKDGVIYVSGHLEQPAKGRFFFQKQTLPGVAGDFVGVVTFDRSLTAYRIEPSGEHGTPELVERPLDQVICRQLPVAPAGRSTGTAEIPPLNSALFPDLPIPGYQNGIVVLESLHGAVPVIYLDFQGGYTASWGGVSYARPNVNNAEIREVWQRVAEDFMPFNINVTTDLAVYQSAPDNSRQRVIITQTTTVAGEAGGVAMIGSFNWTGDFPCWVFAVSGKACSEACAHEVGHTLGLTHDGLQYGGQLYEYFSGDGSGDTSWAPIMGLPYYANVTQWSKGEYLNADNPQDQLSMITAQNNNVAYRPDDTGDTLASSRYLELYSDYSAWAEGVIERTGDTDAFQFATSGGMVWLRADPVSAGPNLAIAVSLYDEHDAVVAENNPQDTLWADLTTNLPAGTYTFRVSGAGRNDPVTNGFSSYGSLGYYSITGSVANARLPNRFTIPEHATNGTLVGVIPFSNTNDDPLVFSIVSGNTGSTFAVDSAGNLSVARNTLLDYDTLAGKTQLPVQFDLLVNITDALNLALNETNRRVVIAITYVPTPPFTQQRAGYLSVSAGTNVIFTIGAQGDLPLSYQWTFNGKPISGAIGTALSLTNVQAPDIGSYAVVITNSLGAITSLVAQLAVIPAPPSIAAPPQPLVVPPGFPAAFSVAAQGTEPFSYQWQRAGTNVPGADAQWFRLNRVQPQAAGVYKVVVSNAFGSTSSAEALLAITPVAAWGWDDSGQTNLFFDLTNAVQISAGPTYNLALRRSGSIFAWGEPKQSNLPVNLTNICAISAGGAHGLALTSGGTVVGWGANTSGQAAVPIGLGNVVAVAAGGSHSLALKSDGHVVSWGLQPAVPLMATNIIAIAAGSNHSLALRADGKVVAWGDNTFGQTRVPTNLIGVVSIAAGAWHSLALQSNGTVAAWGNNTNHQCLVPPGLSNVTAIAAGAFHSLALTGDGKAVAWGAGSTNAQKFPDWGQCLVPGPILNQRAVAIAGGAAHSLVLVGNDAPWISASPVGSLAFGGQRVIFRVTATGGWPLGYQWQLNGLNLPGQTNQVLIIDAASADIAGNYRVVITNAFGSVTSAAATLALQNVAPAIDIQPLSQTPFFGGSVTLQVDAYGSAPLYYQWRFNGTNIAGAKRTIYALQNLHLDQSGYYSVLVSNAYGVVSSAKAKISVMQVAAWGAGTNFTGYPNFGQSIVPGGLPYVMKLAGGTYHSLAIDDAGRVVGWGAGTNFSGFGGFDEGQAAVPPSVDRITAIAGGQYHSLALRGDGVVFGWGASSDGATVPPLLNDVIQIAAGAYHSVALRRDGQVVVWGANSAAQLTNVPPGAVKILAISSRANQILALRNDGRLIRWGDSTIVPLGLADVVDVAAGDYHCLALRSDGTVASWGGSSLVPPGILNIVQIAAGSGFSVALTRDGQMVIWADNPLNPVVRRPAGLANVAAVACGEYHCLAALGDGSPSICVQPLSRLVAAGDRTFLRVGATGTQPLLYQWRVNGTNLINATSAVLRFDNVQPTNAGDYQVIVTNPRGAVLSSVANINVNGLSPAGSSLDTALGSGWLPWIAGGNANWSGQTNVLFNSLPSAQSGPIGDSQQSWVQTSVAGPGSISFWWKVSSEQFFDFLNFYLDGVHLAGISGELDWRSTNFTIPGGLHTLRWNYEKDPSTTSGQDAGWLAQVSFVPNFPTIVAQPAGQTSWIGSNIVLSASAVGLAPLTLQWFKDGSALAGATDDVFVISNATRRSSGLYQLMASNLFGSVESVNATVVVRVPQKLTPMPALNGGSFQFLSADADGGALLPGDLAGFQAQSSTNLADWLNLSNALQLSNGVLWWSQPFDSSNNARFYRVLEKSQ